MAVNPTVLTLMPVAQSPWKPVDLSTVKWNDALSAAQKASAASSASPQTAATPQKTLTGELAQDKDHFSFKDFLDIINPLQHIPIVSTIYREITGDKIGNFARVAGGALYGGIIGAALGGINAVADDATGHDVGELAMAKMGIGNHKHDDTAPIAVAAAAPSQENTGNTGNVPMIEVHPLSHAEQAATKSVTLDATPLLAAAKTSTAPTALPPHLVAQHFRHYDLPGSAGRPLPTDSAVLPMAKNTHELPAVLPGAQTVMQPSDAPAPIANAQIPGQMMQALAKYQSMQFAATPSKTSSLAGMTADSTAE